MILYHGSQNKFETLEKHQAQKGEDMIVPEDELQNAIYLTPDFAYALATCSMPDGKTHIYFDNKTIETEFPEKFDPNKKIYIYRIDSDKYPKEQFEHLTDGMQIVSHLDKMDFESVEELTAGEVLKYYKLLNYEDFEGVKSELNSEFKLR